MQDIVNGLAQGSIYALAGVGLVLIFSVVRVPNFAHGESVMVAAMLPLTLMSVLHIPLIAALLIGIAASAALGMVLAGGVFAPLRRYSETAMLMVSLALVVMISSIAVMFWGDDARITPGGPQSIVAFAGARVPVSWIIIFAAAILATVMLDLFVRYSSAGRVMRAMARNAMAAQLMGIPVRRYQILAFMIGSGLAGLAGALFSVAFSVQATMGAMVALKSFIVIIFAGIGSIWGALFGGLLLGIIESFGASFISSGYKDTFGFVFLLAVLLLRPNGLFVSKGS